MVRRILITGAGGFLGSRLFEYFSGREEYEAIGVTHRELEIGDALAVKAFIRAIRPHAVLHCAAVSNTGRCQQEPRLSELVNVQGTVNIARACREAGCRMIFMSSDQIYDTSAGTSEANREGTEGRPVPVYGRDKKRAETLMFQCLEEAVALRLSWMYDYPGKGRVESSNLLRSVLQAASEGSSLSFPVYDHRGITYVWEVVRNIEKALKLPPGVYNFGSSNHLSSFDTAVFFAKTLFGEEVPEGLLIPDTSRFSLSPRNLAMDMTRAEAEGIYFNNTEAGLMQCLSETEGWKDEVRQKFRAVQAGA